MEAKYLRELSNEVKIKGTWTKEELMDRIQKKMESAHADGPRVKEIALYDIFRISLHKIPHPCIIFRMEDNLVWGILTSTNAEGYHNVMKIEGSRQMEEGWWTSTIICQTKENALKDWLGIFDNPSNVKKAVRELKNYYQNILK